jgi:hypothetical protein
MKPNVNSVEVHPQLSNDSHPLDGALVGIGHGEIVRKAYFKWYGKARGTQTFLK